MNILEQNISSPLQLTIIDHMKMACDAYKRLGYSVLQECASAMRELLVFCFYMNQADSEPLLHIMIYNKLPYFCIECVCF